MKTSCQRFIALSVMTILLSLLLATASFAEIKFKGNVGLAFNDQAVFRGMATMKDTNYQAIGIAGLKMEGAGPGTFHFGLLGKYGHDVKNKNGVKDNGLKNKRNDVRLAYTLPLFDKKMSLTAGHIAYLYTSTTVDNNNEAFISAKANIFLKPTFTVYYDYESDNNGLFYTAGISKGFKLMENLKLGLGGLVSYNDESTVKMKATYTDFHHAQATASLKWNPTKQLAIIPNILASAPLSDDAEDLGKLNEEFRYGIKMVVSF